MSYEPGWRIEVRGPLFVSWESFSEEVVREAFVIRRISCMSVVGFCAVANVCLLSHRVSGSHLRWVVAGF